MILSVHQHWDPLKVCIVGRSYPPEFYSYIKDSRVRNVFEKIAEETEEDFQKLISKLKEFNVEVLRTDISEDLDVYNVTNGNGDCKKPSPPLCPRDFTAMVGERFFMPGKNYGDTSQFLKNFISECTYKEILENLDKNPDVQKYLYDLLLPGRPVNLSSVIELKNIIKKGYCNRLNAAIDQKKFDDIISQSCTNTIGSNDKFPNFKRFDAFKSVREYVQRHGNEIIYDEYINTATMSRIGKDLYFGLNGIINKLNEKFTKKRWRKMFPDHRTHTIDLPGHTDGCFCPVKPGLIVSCESPSYYKETFPDWEVVSIPNELKGIKSHLKKKRDMHSKGRYWISGEEDNNVFHDYISDWMNHWVTYVEETIFDVNMLVIDEKNVLCNNVNEKVFDAFNRHGITPHIINFRHRYFWDGGLHCITSDIDRSGKQKNFFPDRDE